MLLVPDSVDERLAVLPLGTTLDLDLEERHNVVQTRNHTKIICEYHRRQVSKVKLDRINRKLFATNPISSSSSTSENYTDRNDTSDNSNIVHLMICKPLTLPE